MTLDQFLEDVSPIPDHNYLYFVKGDMSLGQFAFCRAYINFLKQEDVFIFRDKFDGYVFIDTKGNEFPAIVEFAPSQKVPRRRVGPNGFPASAKKRDNKAGSIEQDPDYLAFLENLEKSKNEANLPSADVYLEEIEAKEKELKANHGCPKLTTPLIEFIKQKKQEKVKQREERREERRRQQEMRKMRDEEQRRVKDKIKIKKNEDLQKKKEAEKQKPKEKPRLKDEKSDKRDYEKQDEKRKTQSERERHDSLGDKPKEILEKRKSDSKSSAKPSEQPTVVKLLQKSEVDKNKESREFKESKADKSAAKGSEKEGERQKSERSEARIDHNKEADNNTSDKRADSENSKSRDARRMRNKDRPAREIYQPGERFAILYLNKYSFTFSFQYFTFWNWNLTIFVLQVLAVQHQALNRLHRVNKTRGIKQMQRHRVRRAKRASKPIATEANRKCTAGRRIQMSNIICTTAHNAMF